MKIEILVSALLKEPENLIETMGLKSDAVIVNQCDRDDERTITCNGFNVRVFENTERGVGNSRNLALGKAVGDIVLFSDDDIVYSQNYEKLISDEFDKHPEADGIFFNMNVDPSRATYHTKEFGPVTFRNSGRYPTYSLAVKREPVVSKGILFSTLFGGGAKYSCGEDSLFIMDLLKSGLKLYKSPATIGSETYGESTWFTGYNEKFFFDKGVLYHFLYGKLAALIGLRFILKHKSTMCKEIKTFCAYRTLLRGIKEGRGIA